MPDAPNPRTENDPVAWVREHWALVGGVVLVLLVLWALSGGDRRRENGRYVLVKDDVPCQTAEPSGRRWCYVVLDTRTGKLEERVRHIGNP